MYQHGEGVDKDYKKAVEWFEKAAEEGLAAAQFHLGQMYESGWGVGQSDSMAMRWFAKAAAQGLEPAQAAFDRVIASRRARPWVAAAQSHQSLSPASPSGMPSEDRKKKKKGKKKNAKKMK
jgi:TPR repeat protein